MILRISYRIHHRNTTSPLIFAMTQLRQYPHLQINLDSLTSPARTVQLKLKQAVYIVPLKWIIIYKWGLNLDVSLVRSHSLAFCDQPMLVQLPLDTSSKQGSWSGLHSHKTDVDAADKHSDAHVARSIIMKELELLRQALHPGIVFPFSDIEIVQGSWCVLARTTPYQDWGWLGSSTNAGIYPT